jgi:hypothetical protein
MNLSRFALSALLAISPFAVTLAKAQTAAAAGPASAPALPPAVLARLLKLMAVSGVDSEMPASIATALGVTTAGPSWPDRQLAVESSASGSVHALTMGRGDDMALMLSARGPAAISVYRIRRDGVVVSGVDYFLQTKQVTPLTPAQVEAGFAAERSFWMANIDRLDASN